MFGAVSQHHTRQLEKLLKVPAGKWVRLARARQANDMRDLTGFHFDLKRAERVRQFFNFLQHSKGRWAGQPFEPAPWQLYDVLWPLFGWVDARGHRRFREAYIEVAKKNGKSTLAAGIGLYLQVGDREPGAEVYSVATKRDQARIIHKEAIRMAKSSEKLRKYLTTNRNNIAFPLMASSYEPLASNADKQDGINVHGALVDELHRHKNRDLLDVIGESTAARQQPLIVYTTTAGYDRHSPCWQIRDYATRLLDGVFRDDRFFVYIATLDEEDDPFDPAVWCKANPNLGISIDPAELASKAERATQSVANLNAFLRFRLNLWTQTEVRWLQLDEWRACRSPLSNAELDTLLADKMCVVGLDLSSTLDITAIGCVFPLQDGTLVVKCFSFVPEDTVRERTRRDRVPYEQFVADGWLQTTPGNVVDYDYIRDFITNDLGKRYRIEEICYDPWNATQLVTQLEKAGFRTTKVQQGFSTLSAPTKFFETLVKRQQLQHDGNVVLEWMAGNVAVRQNSDGNLRPDKSKSTEKIDGVAALITALARLVTIDGQDESVYASRGFTVI